MRDTSNNDQDLLVFEDIYPLENILEDAGFKSGGPTEWGSSYWKRALHCPYDAVLLRRHGFEATSKKALIIGIIVHEAISRRYTRLRETLQCSTAEALGPVEAVSVWARKRLEQGPSSWAERLWACAETARELIVAYCARWEPYFGAPLVTHLETFDFSARAIGPVEGVLKALDALVEGPFPWTQRLDLQMHLVEPSGALVLGVVDHKTRSGTWDEVPWSRMWWQEAQVWGAAYLCELYRGKTQSIPPCRYVVINAMTKPSRATEPPTFDRYVYLVAPERLAVWKRSMELHWKALRSYFVASKDVPDEDLWRIVPMSFGGACQRQYGSCPRFNSCLQVIDRAFHVQIQVLSSLPQSGPSLVEPAGSSTPTQVEPLEEEPHVELDPDVEFSGIPQLGAKIITDEFLGPGVLASETTRGQAYYHNTMILWSRAPDRSTQGECLFWSQGGIEIGFQPDRKGFVPVRIRVKGERPLEERVEERSTFPPPSTPLELIRTEPIGEVAKSTGMVPVYWLGSHTKAGKKLEERFREMSGGSASYGIALAGRDPTKRGLRVWTWVSGIVAQSTKRSVGVDGWKVLEKMACEAAGSQS